MYLVRKVDRESGKNYTWRQGEKKPRHKDGAPFNDVVEFSADGKDLELIRKRFRNLPDIPEAGFVLWRGDLGQFIYDGLVYDPAPRLTPSPNGNKAVSKS